MGQYGDTETTEIGSSDVGELPTEATEPENTEATAPTAAAEPNDEADEDADQG